MTKDLEYRVSINGKDVSLNEKEFLLYLDSCHVDYGIKPENKKAAKSYAPVEFRCEPLGSAKLKREIIRNFCEQNQIDVPEHLSEKNSYQIHGLFRGMTSTYGKLYYTDLDRIF